MSPQKQLRTFISYSRVNKQFALKLATELKAAGFLIWLDQFDIPTGKRWDDEIEKALRECEIFMVVMTPASIASENAKDEIGYAIDHGKRIMPVLLEECEIPLRLRRLQYVDFTHKNFNQGIDSAKELLARLINEETVPTPARTVAADGSKDTLSLDSGERATHPYNASLSRIDDFSREEPVVSGRKNPSTKIIAGIIAGIVVLALVILLISPYIGEIRQNKSAETPETAVPEVAAAIETATMPSATSNPTESPVPTGTATIPSATSVPSETSVPTETPTILVAPTSDPRFYTEEFDFATIDELKSKWTDKKFYVDQTEKIFKYSLNNGHLSVDVSVLLNEGSVPRILLLSNDDNYEGVQLETKFKNTTNAFGVSLICGYGSDGWYDFSIGNDQNYGIYAYDATGKERQNGGKLKSGASPHIKTGQNAENVLTVTCTEDELILKINGVDIQTIDPTKYGYTGGQVGVGIFAPSLKHVTVEIDSVTISEP
jgi:hypothetical protein